MPNQSSDFKRVLNQKLPPFRLVGNTCLPGKRRIIIHFANDCLIARLTFSIQKSLLNLKSTVEHLSKKGPRFHHLHDLSLSTSQYTHLSFILLTSTLTFSSFLPMRIAKGYFLEQNCVSVWPKLVERIKVNLGSRDDENVRGRSTGIHSAFYSQMFLAQRQSSQSILST